MDWTGRHIAVTGATGFLGHHLVAEMCGHGASVTALVRSPLKAERLTAMGACVYTAPLEEPQAMEAVARDCDTFFHLAGAVDFGGDWERLQAVNEVGTRNAVAAARAAGVRRFVHVSSIVAVGGTRRPRPIDETFRWNLGPMRSGYVTTKRRGERIALAANAADFEVVVANPACVIGPDDFDGSEFGTLCHRFWRGHIPIYFGGGINVVDVRDVAIGLRRAAEIGCAGERYILGGENRTMTAFFSELARQTGRAIPRIGLPSACAPTVAWLHDRLSRPGKQRPAMSADQARLAGLYFFYDCSKATRDLGYRPRPLNVTLTDTYSYWMRRRAA